MAVTFGRRISIMAGLMIGALALVVPASPASAQAGGPGAQATPVVGVSPTANCPTPVPGAVVQYVGPAGPFNITQSGGRCTSFSAAADGSFTIGGATGTFAADCQTGGLQHGGGVTVPTGTIVNGVAVTQPTVITTLNTPVIFPGGGGTPPTPATLNVVSTTPTTVTRTAIVSGGTSIGRVICGAADIYPLTVDTAAAAAPAPALPLTSSGDDDGAASTALLLAGALALAVAAQLTIGRKMWRRKGDVTG